MFLFYIFHNNSLSYKYAKLKSENIGYHYKEIVPQLVCLCNWQKHQYLLFIVSLFINTYVFYNL